MSDPKNSQNRFALPGPLRDGQWLLNLTGLCLTLIIVLLLYFPPLLLRQAELRVYDLLVSGRTTPPQTSIPVIIGVDEESLRQYGQWPWPRYRVARLVERLHGLGADVVSLDFLMPEADRTSPGVITTERRRDGLDVSGGACWGRDDTNSAALGRAMEQGATVLGFYFDFSGGPVLQAAARTTVIPSGMVVSAAPGISASWPAPGGLIRSIPVLSGAAGAEGFTNAIHDLDGALRRVPLLLFRDGVYYPSFALSTMLLASHGRTLRLANDGGQAVLVWENRRIPLDRQGNMLLDYRSERKPFEYVSAASILNGSQLPGSLKGRIALVGAWAKGLGDLHLVPSGSSLYGLSIHANIIDNVLSGSYISRPYWAGGAELFCVLLLGVVSSWLMGRNRLVYPLAVMIAGGGGCLLVSCWLLVFRGLHVSPLLPVLTPLVVIFVLGLLKYLIEAGKVRQRNMDLLNAQDTIIISMSSLAAARDMETGRHIMRTQKYVEILARELANNPGFGCLDENAVQLLAKSAPLHDIGKVGIPDGVLQKGGELTEEEFAIMKSHTLIGGNALARTIGGAGRPEQNAFLDYARQMIESHHERWDGSGYPRGLRGEEIPLAGRLMALADVYDALVSRRVYKDELPHEKVRQMILEGAGSMFDPDVVSAFDARHLDFRRVAMEFADGE